MQVSFPRLDGRHSSLLSYPFRPILPNILDSTPLTPISLTRYHDYYTGKSVMGTSK